MTGAAFPAAVETAAVGPAAPSATVTPAVVATPPGDTAAVRANAGMDSAVEAAARRGGSSVGFSCDDPRTWPCDGLRPRALRRSRSPLARSGDVCGGTAGPKTGSSDSSKRHVLADAACDGAPAASAVAAATVAAAAGSTTMAAAGPAPRMIGRMPLTRPRRPSPCELPLWPLPRSGGDDGGSDGRTPRRCFDGRSRCRPPAAVMGLGADVAATASAVAGANGTVVAAGLRRVLLRVQNWRQHRFHRLWQPPSPSQQSRRCRR